MHARSKFIEQFFPPKTILKLFLIFDINTYYLSLVKSKYVLFVL